MPIFSPRKPGMLEWYAGALRDANASAMFTAAFGVSQPLAEALGEDRDFLRLLLMESPEKDPARLALITADRDTVIALGERLNAETIQLEIDGFRLDQWFRAEEHFRKEGHIFYIHTKILGLDLLSEDPQAVHRVGQLLQRIGRVERREHAADARARLSRRSQASTLSSSCAFSIVSISAPWRLRNACRRRGSPGQGRGAGSRRPLGCPPLSPRRLSRSPAPPVPLSDRPGCGPRLARRAGSPGGYLSSMMRR